MRVAPQDLEARLRRGLAPVYLVLGDEPLQLGEALQAVRDHARRGGFSERQVIEQTKDFDWGQLAAEAAALSLFATRRLLELRLLADKLGRDGADALRQYCERPGEDVLLLIAAPALSWKDLKAKWAQAIDARGVIVEARRPRGADLAKWLEQRLRARGFLPTPEAVGLFAERVEGHLLAADQAIARLALLREPGPLDATALLAAVSDSARFDLFDLSGAALTGDRARARRVLRGLAGEGTAASLVLWVLARELRMLAAVAFARSRGDDLNAVFAAHQVWDTRRPSVLAALRRYPLELLWTLLLDCARVDLAIKGQAADDPWLLLADIADRFAAGG